MCHQIFHLYVSLVISCPVLPHTNLSLLFSINIFCPNLYVHPILAISNTWLFFCINSNSHVFLHSYILFMSFCNSSQSLWFLLSILSILFSHKIHPFFQHNHYITHSTHTTSTQLHCKHYVRSIHCKKHVLKSCKS